MKSLVQFIQESKSNFLVVKHSSNKQKHNYHPDNIIELKKVS